MDHHPIEPPEILRHPRLQSRSPAITPPRRTQRVDWKALPLNISCARIIQAHHFHRARTALRKFANRLGRSSRSRRKRGHHVQQPRFLSTHSLCQDTSRGTPGHRRTPRWLKMEPRNTPS